MSEDSKNQDCEECGIAVADRPTAVEFDGQEIHLFNPVVCEKCLLELCRKFSVKCVNCGGSIPPYSQVGVLKGDGDKAQFVHMTTECSTVGSAFHGFWGRGKLHNFVQIEAC